jgi:hypothetical protein
MPDIGKINSSFAFGVEYKTMKKQYDTAFI